VIKQSSVSKEEDGYYYIDENGKKQRNDIQDYEDIMEE
jgi:hypothetical protein